MSILKTNNTSILKLHEEGSDDFVPYDDPEDLFETLTFKHESQVQQAREQLSVKLKGGFDDSYYLRAIIRSNWSTLATDQFYEYFIHYVMRMFPTYNYHEWRQDMIYHFCMCWCDSKKEYATHGASNCQKTSTMAMCSCAFWLLMPEYISIYVTSPYKDASESGIWANIVEFYEEVSDTHDWVDREVDCRHIESRHVIRMNDQKYPRGFLRVVTSDKVGKLVGRKPKTLDKGALIFILDEAPEFRGLMCSSVLTLLMNLKSVRNMRAWASGNFARPDDLLGRISYPDRHGGYRSLNVDRDFGWTTIRGGIVRRYDGHYSPNVKAGFNRWDGLNTKEDLESLLADSHGIERSPGYMRFGRSFPVLEEEMWTILNSQMIAKANVHRQPMWFDDKQQIYGFCDPGWGGDPAAIIGVQRGKIYEGGDIKDHIHVFVLPETIPVEVPDLDEDDFETINAQIVDYCIKWCFKHRVQYSNFGFDGSMRSAIVQEFDKRANRSNGRFRAIDNLGKPSDKDAQRIADGWKKGYAQKGGGGLRLASDLYVDFNTEQHFDIQYLMVHSQITSPDARYTDKAFDQLCNRMWDFRGNKKKIQTKKDYKEKNQGISPTESDILVGAVQMAIMRRFGFGAIQAARGNLNSNAAYSLSEKTKKVLDSGRIPGKLNRRF